MLKYIAIIICFASCAAQAQEFQTFLEKPANNSKDGSFYIKVENPEEDESEDIIVPDAEIVAPSSQPSEQEHTPRSIFDVLFGSDDVAQDIDNEVKSSDSESVLVEDDKSGQFVGSGTVKVIDRTLGKLYVIDAQIGNKSYVNELIIRMRNCWHTNDKSFYPDDKAFVEIYESRGKNQVRIFSGWMLAKHPALSVVEHPKYDISLLKCMTSKKESDKDEDAKPEKK